MTEKRKTISEILDERTAIDEALRAGVRRALLRHKKLGESIVVWRDGKVVEIPAEDIAVEDPPPGPGGG